MTIIVAGGRMKENAYIRHVLAFLADPAVHGLGDPITRIDTHGAAVFLAGKDAYKVKRSAIRSWICPRSKGGGLPVSASLRSIVSMRPSVVPISRDGCRLKFGDGDVIEWAVHLRRFDENRTLDRLAERGSLDREIIVKLAQAAALSHQRAQVIASADAGQALRGQIEETLTSLEAAPDIFAPQAASALRNAMSQAFARWRILAVGARETRPSSPLPW